MKIAVTGGTGFIGKYLVRELSGENEIVVLAIEEGEIPPVANEKYCHTDFSTESIKELIAGCDCIVHMASIRPPQNGDVGMSYFNENITITDNVFCAAKETGITNIVMISSRSVYNSNMPMPFREESTAPYSMYGISKLMTENLSEFYNRKYGMKIKQLRLAQVMGIGERKNLMTVYLEKASNRETLPIYGKGVSAKTYIYVKDVVRAVKCALEHPDVDGAFNIAMDRAVSNAELAKLYCKVFDNEDNYVFLQDKPEDGEVWTICTEKAKKVLGYSAEYTVEAALNDMKEMLSRKKISDKGAN